MGMVARVLTVALPVSAALAALPSGTAARASSLSARPVGRHTPEASSFRGTPAVGALVTLNEDGAIGAHFCTASVVASPDRDLVMTAAHCVGNAPGRLEFIPAFDRGHAPYGIWRITSVFVDRSWRASHDPDDDFAFLVAGVSASGKRVQTVTGGESLGVDPPLVETVDVIGYPDGQRDPVTCTNRTTRFKSTQLQFDCGGFTDGTSGGPFLAHVDAKTRLGTVIGVIGGYELGGDSSAVSYAARLASRALTLYRAVVRSKAAKSD